MFGDARDTDEPFGVAAAAAALERAVDRLKGLAYRLRGTLQARFNLARPEPRRSGTGACIIPIVRYRDVPAAIAWLCRAFGMQAHRVVTDAKGGPCFAELTIGNGMLMVLSIEDSAFGKLMVQPDEIGGVETQICYLCVPNARAHHARAKAAGAVIIIDPEHESNRGRGYSCRDPEGHVWNFCTYNPWARQPSFVRRSAGWNPRRLQQGIAALALLVLGGALLIDMAPQPAARAGTATAEPDIRAPLALLATVDERPSAAGAATVAAVAAPEADAHKDAREAVLAAAERSAADARTQLAEVSEALERAQQEAATTRAQLTELQRAKAAAERAAQETRRQLAAAQNDAERAHDEATHERAKRLAADRAADRAASRVRRRVSPSYARARPSWPRTWCYSSGAPMPASNSASRLAGFCKT